MGESYLGQVALKYATEYGWAVFPVRSSTKKPLTPHGCKDAKKDPGAIQAWWKRYPNASIGIATGSASNLIVVDEDVNDNTGVDGRISIRLWEKEHGPLPETVQAITGRGGSHLYYHYEGNDIGNRTAIIEGVDIRGEGGYVIAPPSLHPNGANYEWEMDPCETPIAEVDETLKEFLATGAKMPGTQFRVPERIEAGARNDTLYKMACSLQSQGYSDDGILAMVMAENMSSCVEPLPDDEIIRIVNSALKHKKGENKLIAQGDLQWREPRMAMKVTKDGEITDTPAQTISNAEEAICFDQELFRRIQYNDLAYTPYVYGNLPWAVNRGWREWTNNDDSHLLSYIEKKYGLKNHEKIMLGFQNVATQLHFNPVREMLEECAAQWDGDKHVENLLPQFLGAEKNEYTTAVMRLFMMGAVARVFKPGCKFDYMLVLVGDQGIGKSEFLRFLALNDGWFHDNLSALDSVKAIEQLRGVWIAEVAEMQAMKRTKDVETIKAFITSRIDTYRAPYNRRTEQRPRMCVLAGTSNPTDFLTDKTGNRRFLPVTCSKSRRTNDMFANETFTRNEMVQAWGEIMHEYQTAGGRIPLVLPKHLQAIALKEQTAYVEDDPWIGQIQHWLNTHPEIGRVCVGKLWRECLDLDSYSPIPAREINRLHDIMKNNIDGWSFAGKQLVDGYGVQRAYERNSGFIDTTGMEIEF